MKAILVVFVSLIIINSCGNSPTENKPNYKDPFTMTWTVDTLEYPGSYQTTLSSIWGSSPTDVYAVGHNESNSGKFWHYDGLKWESIDLFKYVEMSSWNLTKVYGFSPNDFWVIGARDRQIVSYEYKESNVLQYKNGWWIDHKLKYDSWIADITGTSSSDIWACGTKGVVLKYNGFSWKADTVRKKIEPNTTYGIYGIVKNKNEIFLLWEERNPYIHRIAYYFIRGNLNNWKFVDSVVFQGNDWNSDYKFGSGGIYKTDSGAIYSYGGQGIWIWNSNADRWEQKLKNNYLVRSVQGTGDDYLIATADFGLVWFYNGTQWVELKNLINNQSQIDFYDSWTNGKEIFLLGTNGSSTFILHGK